MVGENKLSVPNTTTACVWKRYPEGRRESEKQTDTPVREKTRYSETPWGGLLSDAAVGWRHSEAAARRVWYHLNFIYKSRRVAECNILARLRHRINGVTSK